MVGATCHAFEGCKSDRELLVGFTNADASVVSSAIPHGEKPWDRSSIPATASSLGEIEDEVRALAKAPLIG